MGLILSRAIFIVLLCGLATVPGVLLCRSPSVQSASDLDHLETKFWGAQGSVPVVENDSAEGVTIVGHAPLFLLLEVLVAVVTGLSVGAYLLFKTKPGSNWRLVGGLAWAVAIFFCLGVGLYGTALLSRAHVRVECAPDAIHLSAFMWGEMKVEETIDYSQTPRIIRRANDGVDAKVWGADMVWTTPEGLRAISLASSLTIDDAEDFGRQVAKDIGIPFYTHDMYDISQQAE